MVPTQILALLQTGSEVACGSDPTYICDLVYDLTGSELAATTADLLVRPFKVVVILFIAWILNRIVRRLITRTVARIVKDYEEKEAADIQVPDENDDELGRFETLRVLAAKRALRVADQAERGRRRAETLGSVLRSIAALAIYTTAIIMALGEFNVSLGPLIASAGILGIALGFGAQSLVRDFLSGIFMFVEDQYGVGDIIDVGEAVGVVEDVKLRTTKIRDVNGALWHVPNGEIRRVSNKSQEWARVILDVEVAYDTDLDLATAVIKRVADEMWEETLPDATILEEPEVQGVQNFGPDAIVIRLAVKVEPAEQFAAARELRRRLKDAFDESGIQIPFPQRTIWVHNVTATGDGDSPAASAAQPADTFGGD